MGASLLVEIDLVQLNHDRALLYCRDLVIIEYMKALAITCYYGYCVSDHLALEDVV